MKVELKDNEIVITLPRVRVASKSGKSILIATTSGNIPTSAQIDGKPLIVSVNAYISR